MDYKFTPTSKISSLTKQLDQASFFINQFPVPPQIISNLRRQSTLHSSLFSARIEGNQLTLDQVSTGIYPHSQDKQKLEIQNLLAAHNYIFSTRPPQRVSLKLIQTLHSYVIRGLSPDAGHFRSEQTAIFNQAGVAIYVTPPPDQIRPRLQALLQSPKPSLGNVYTTAAFSHFVFEKIHPFVDGNGRVGRLLTQFHLDRAGYKFKGLLAFEKLLDQFRSEYYSLLNQNSTDTTLFIEFYLEMILFSAREAISNLKSSPVATNPEDELLPRRREIYLLIRDHTYLSFDQIHRRFPAVNPSTLRYDIRQLLTKEFIKKIGATRGTLYSAKDVFVQVP